ncbi:uncharacterized protein N7477_000159 [Penicillium maclennaniae]|uniref:uncharacterized protein n=1 Tax=Penicillium maclennaniae TaxID=1343394 RepID=UPI002540A1EC|nr:uncharacterized protein N7477_000159 [Penicillium maclennaniae]KAJ5683814.1 hypothetical protein N7477_000159 [Penicillium maclennaniae]
MSADEGGDTTPMPATNGEPHQDSNVAATPGKRKRSSQEEKLGADSNATTAREKANLHENLRSLVDLLLKHDTELQLLSCQFATSGAKPRAKRAKISSDQETSNIQNRVESDRYSTLQEFLADIERASAAVIERNQNQANGTKTDGTPLTEVVNRIAAFKKHMNSLIGQSFVNQPEVKIEVSDDEENDQIHSTVSYVGAREDRQALTLFGGSQSNPKQLFSSLQKSVQVPLQSSGSDEPKFVEVHEELREGALPNGIAASKVVPYNLNAATPPKRTIGEVFGPRPGFPPLRPPQKHDYQSTSVSWIDPFDAVFDPKLFFGERNNYCLSSLPSGQWLQYGGVTSSPAFWSRVEKDHAEAEIRPKHGDPALWTGDDSSLLQGVYSSFAPSFDSSGAVLEPDSKDMVWWMKRGAKRLRTLLSLPVQDFEEETSSVEPGSIGDLDDAALEEMMKACDTQDFSYDFDQEYPSKQNPESRESEEMLQEISEMLDTLSSYQRIRNLVDPVEGEKEESDETPAPDFGTPENPSDAEKAVYEHLKTTLISIISSLPPYAVAKLDGDRLADLNVSQKILIENPDYSGTMERDDYTLHQERVAAMAAASSATNRTSTPVAARPGSFSTPQTAYNQRSFASNARAPLTQGGFQVPQSARQPSASSSFTSGYTGGRPSSTPSQRPSYTPQQQQFSQANSQYSQANNVPQFQRPVQNGHSAQQSQSPQPYTPRPGQSGYNATPQGRVPYANAGQRQPYTTQTPSQGGHPNTAAATTYARSAAEQAVLMDRNKAQLAAQQSRKSPSTPQPGIETRQSQEGSLTPGSRQNGTPVTS